MENVAEEIETSKQKYIRRSTKGHDPEPEVITPPSLELHDIITNPSTVNDVKKATKALKNENAPDVDQIYAEILMVEEQITSIHYHHT